MPLSQPERAEIIYETTMLGLQMLGEVFQRQIDELNERANLGFDGCSDE